jgi:nucleoside-triphosphatase
MKNKSEVFILTGEIHSGKTTALEKWSKGKSVSGILTPIVEERRVVYDLKTASYFPLEANADDENIISVGRYHFSQEAFHKMNVLLKQQSNRSVEWVVIDEVGLLELDGKGLYDSVVYLLENAQPKLIFVVRESLVQRVKEYFSLTEVRVILIKDLAIL